MPLTTILSLMITINSADLGLVRLAADLSAVRGRRPSVCSRHRALSRLLDFLTQKPP